MPQVWPYKKEIIITFLINKEAYILGFTSALGSFPHGFNVLSLSLSLSLCVCVCVCVCLSQIEQSPSISKF